ncbi:MAG: 3'(2'), 5'-bisphosphate nucleotidase [Flavobacteriales bacterium]|jgi:3'(2'), 5'-bisphosphate nucleotidase
MNFSKILDIALQASCEAAEGIIRVKKAGYDKWVKEDQSPVTEADYESNRILIKHLEPLNIPILSEEQDDIPYETRKNWTTFWSLDPLDGTKEFIKGLPEFTINIALIHEGEPVLGIVAIPESKKVYYGYGDSAWKANVSEGTIDQVQKLNPQPPGNILRVAASRSHLSSKTSDYIEGLKTDGRQLEIIQAGSALKFCLIAEGTAHIYPRFNPCMEWDTAAAHAILKAVGKNILQMDNGKQLEYNKPSLLNPSFLAQ